MKKDVLLSKLSTIKYLLSHYNFINNKTHLSQYHLKNQNIFMQGHFTLCNTFQMKINLRMLKTCNKTMWYIPRQINFMSKKEAVKKQHLFVIFSSIHFKNERIVFVWIQRWLMMGWWRVKELPTGTDIPIC